MPRVDLNVRGHICGLEVNMAYDKDGNKVDVSQICPYVLANMLDYGELTINIEIPNTIKTSLYQAGFTACRENK